jgi:hypothetical protein
LGFPALKDRKSQLGVMVHREKERIVSIIPFIVSIRNKIYAFKMF